MTAARVSINNTAGKRKLKTKINSKPEINIEIKMKMNI